MSTETSDQDRLSVLEGRIIEQTQAILDVLEEMGQLRREMGELRQELREQVHLLSNRIDRMFLGMFGTGAMMVGLLVTLVVQANL